MRPLPIVAICSLALLIPVQAANAAERLGKSGQNEMVRNVAQTGPGRDVKLRITAGGKVTFDATFQYIVTANNVLAVRSSIAPKWGMLAVASGDKYAFQRTFLVKRSRGSWKAIFSANRGDENLEICKLKQPNTPIALDLGFSDAGTWGERCKHKRKRTSLVRGMTAPEMRSVRDMVETRWVGAVQEPGPVQPKVTDDLVSNSNCLWDGSSTSLVDKAQGEVSKANPRWGAVDVGCIAGPGYNVTQYLVRRSGRTGAFSAVPAHVLASWSSYPSICDESRKWSVPTSSRVALEFCSPFPSVVRSVFR